MSFELLRVYTPSRNPLSSSMLLLIEPKSRHSWGDRSFSSAATLYHLISDLVFVPKHSNLFSKPILCQRFSRTHLLCLILFVLFVLGFYSTLNTQCITSLIIVVYLVCGNTMCVSTCQVELFLENCLALFYCCGVDNRMFLLLLLFVCFEKHHQSRSTSF